MAASRPGPPARQCLQARGVRTPRRTSTTNCLFDAAAGTSGTSEGGDVFTVRGLSGWHYHLPRDAIIDAWPAAWPGWSYVQLIGARQPLLVQAPRYRVQVTKRVPHRIGKPRRGR